MEENSEHWYKRRWETSMPGDDHYSTRNDKSTIIYIAFETILRALRILLNHSNIVSVHVLLLRVACVASA